MNIPLPEMSKEKIFNGEQVMICTIKKVPDDDLDYSFNIVKTQENKNNKEEKEFVLMGESCLPLAYVSARLYTLLGFKTEEEFLGWMIQLDPTIRDNDDPGNIPVFIYYMGEVESESAGMNVADDDDDDDEGINVDFQTFVKDFVVSPDTFLNTSMDIGELGAGFYMHH